MLITMLDKIDMGSSQGGDQVRKIKLCCDRGSCQDSKKPSYVDAELRKRRKTRQMECPYQVKILCLSRESMLKVSEGLTALHSETLVTRFHNHDSSEHAAIHSHNRRPAEAEKQEILRLDKGMTISVLLWADGASAN